MYKIIGADGKEYGPVTTQDVLRWISEGRANANTVAQAEGATEWKKLVEFPEFAGALAGKAALPPMGSVPPTAGSLPAPTGVPKANPDALAQAIIARGVYFGISDCLGRGWNLVMADFWPVVGVTALAWVIIGAANSLGVGLFLYGVFLGGLYEYFLKRIRGQAAAVNDLFGVFSTSFLPLMLATIVSILLTALGFFLCVLPGIYLAIAWKFTFFLVVDKKLEFWDAMEVSRKVVNKVWWSVFGLLLLCLLLNMVGFMVLCVGFFVSMPVTIAALAYAYESIFNPAHQPAA